MRMLDVFSWQTLLTTVLGLAVIPLIGVGIRLLIVQTVQQRRERENRRINERLRTLIVAYKVPGGSFTGNLPVDPTHLRDVCLRQAGAAQAAGDDTLTALPDTPASRDRSAGLASLPAYAAPVDGLRWLTTTSA